MIPMPVETKLKQDLTFMVASGPFLLAQGNFSALDELLRRAEEDSSVQALILVLDCRHDNLSFVTKYNLLARAFRR